MKRNIMIAGSYPSIITSGGCPRVNKDLVDNVFLRKYVLILGELLKTKGKLSDIKILYIGGYNREDNISRAKLYISAYNYYLDKLGYEMLNKSNLSVVDLDDITGIEDGIEGCDLLFLGIGEDRVFTDNILELEKRGIKLNRLIRDKNILVSSICSGSVMSGIRIYGGKYDSYYYGKEEYEYPRYLESLNINPVTMETDFCPSDSSDEKNKIFIEEYLKKDSYKCLFFACRPNSFFLIGDEIYAYGEIYLFVDGECIKIEDSLEYSNVSRLVEIVNQYNEVKNYSFIIDKKFLEMIKREVLSLRRDLITDSVGVDEKNFILEFSKMDSIIVDESKIKIDEWKSSLRQRVDYLFRGFNLGNLSEVNKYKEVGCDIRMSYGTKSDNSLEELYLKMNLFSIIEGSYLNYPGYYVDFKKSLYELMLDYVLCNSRVVYYIMEVVGALFSNRELKKILNVLEIENKKSAQQLIDITRDKVKIFRREDKYERS